MKKLKKGTGIYKGKFPLVLTMERLDILLPNVPIQNKKKVMMKELSKNKRRAKPKTKGRSTKRRRPFTLKRTTGHLKKVKKKRNLSTYLWV